MSKRNYEAEYRRLMNALAESVANATDEELQEDLPARPVDSEGQGGKVKAMLLQAADKWAAQRRHQAREAWARGERESRTRSELGETSVDRMRGFLEGLFARKPELAEALTLAHRDFRSWDDRDIRSLYQKALALGLASDDVRDREE